MLSRDYNGRITGGSMPKETKTKIALSMKKLNELHPSDHRHFLGRKHTEETKLKMRLAALGEKNPHFAKIPKTKEAGRIRARRLYGVVEGMDIHHKDGNTFNNSPQNILFVSRKTHMEIDGRLENFIQKKGGS